MGYSYSKVSTFYSCPFQYKLTYVDKLEPKPDLRPTNALWLGTAAHTGIETRNISEALKSYKENYTKLNEQLTDEHELEAYKLYKALELAVSELPHGEYEHKLLNEDGFIGFIDELVEIEPGVYDMYDFKYSNQEHKYKKSEQLHIYKYFFEKLTGNKIRNMYYALLPKDSTTVSDRVNLQEAKLKVDEFYKDKHVTLLPIEYDRNLVGYFFGRKRKMDAANESGVFDKKYTTSCKWCAFKNYCQSNGEDTSDLVLKEEEVKLF